MRKWHTSKGSGGQGLVIDEADGRTVAVAYDAKDAPLLAAAPDLAAVCREILNWCDGFPSGQSIKERRETIFYGKNMLRHLAQAALKKAGV